MTKLSALIEAVLICFMCLVVYMLPLTRATFFGGVPLRVIRDGNNQLLSVSSEGNAFSNGSNSKIENMYSAYFSRRQGKN